MLRCACMRWDSLQRFELAWESWRDISHAGKENGRNGTNENWNCESVQLFIGNKVRLLIVSMLICPDTRLPNKEKSPDWPKPVLRSHLVLLKAEPSFLEQKHGLPANSLRCHAFFPPISPVPGPTISTATTKDEITKQAVFSAAASDRCFLKTLFISAFFLARTFDIFFPHFPHLYFHFGILNSAFSKSTLLIRQNKRVYVYQQLCSVIIILCASAWNTSCTVFYSRGFYRYF